MEISAPTACFFLHYQKKTPEVLLA
ncbi:MAG: AgrD family cyclic lactone autoinducer peptide [Anaerolineae bacterium]